MTRYCVEVCSEIWEYRDVEVEAANAEDAERLAIERVRDADQPPIEARKWEAAGIEATNCEEVAP